MTDIAYTAVVVEDGIRLGIAKRGEAGYYEVRKDSDAGGTFESWDAAREVADAYNERLGLTPEEAMKIVLSSMFEQNRQG